jgi:CDP-glycerol glycerophosphotransferase (TagB/SpsB family)/glycosyltransferase involved in cell wall biosynthesis
VENRSIGYWTAVATSKYLINNATFPWEFVKRPEQVYINTWHGTPLKNMGYDIPGGIPDARNIVRNFVAADYLVSANSRMTDMYLQSYRMRNIFEGKLLETGYPRTDRQTLTEKEQQEALRSLEHYGVTLDPAKKTVLLAPTWKGNNFHNPRQDGKQLLGTIAQLQERLGEDYQVLLKVHQTIYEQTVDLPESTGKLVPNEIPTNVTLALTDTLISDFSSVFFDFLSTGRPLAFYLPDLEEYAENRGTYDQPHELPGPISQNLEDLAEDVKRLHDDQAFSDEWSNRRQEAASRFTPWESGDSTRKLVDVVFGGKTDVEGVRSDFSDGRKKVLLYLGGMASNGITSSALNLLAKIDHTKYDVSALYSFSRAAEKKRNAESIDQRVRTFPRQGSPTASVIGKLGYQIENRRGVRGNDMSKSRTTSTWELEWRRCFGDSKFDYIIDFSGYSPFWSRILLAAPEGEKSVWLHNDLLSDSRRTVDGKQEHKDNLESMFTLYKGYDHLVSVSESLSEINKSKLAEFASADKFTYAVNTIDNERILSMSGRDQADTVELDFEGDEHSLSDVVHQLTRQVGVSTVRDVTARVGLLDGLDLYEPHDAETDPVFVAVGRLSPEKNHERLIRAFAQFRAKRKAGRLYILGDGPLKTRLREVVNEVGAGDYVTLTGALKNPYLVMDRADYFVMSSDYEGQPMVILEARVLGLPVLTTAFDSVTSAVPEGSGLVVDRSVDALADGISKMAAPGSDYASDFDPAEYNERAVAEFVEAIGAKQPATK